MGYVSLIYILNISIHPNNALTRTPCTQTGDTQNILVEQEQDSSGTGSSAAGEQGDAVEVEREENEYICVANDVMEFKLVRAEQDIHDEATTFRPELTHQIFGHDQQIVGYKDLRLMLYYNASTLHTFIGMQHGGCMLPTNAPSPVDKLVKEKIDWAHGAQVPIGHSYTDVLEEFIAV